MAAGAQPDPMDAEEAQEEAAAADPHGDSLFPAIDLDRVTCLNERHSNSGPNCLKPWHERMDESKVCLSEEDDPELILHIPFVSSVIAKSIAIRGGPDGSCPSKIRLFVDRDDISFDNAEDLTAAQEIDVADTASDAAGGGVVEYPLRPSKFNNVHSITLFVQDTHAGDSTALYFVGFKGKHTKYRHGVVEAVYEALGAPEKNDAVKQGLQAGQRLA